MKLLSGLLSGKPALVFSLALGLAAMDCAQAVDLLEVHDQALQNDPQLQAADLRRLASGENRNQAWANFIPSFTVSATRTLGKNAQFVDLSAFGTDNVDTRVDTDTENYNFELRQNIFRFRDFVQLNQSRDQVSRAEADYQTAYQSFLLRVAERYFDVLTAEDGLRFAEAEEKALQRQFEQAEQRFEVGLTAVTDVHEARASYDNARARVIVARNSLEDANEALREVTGQSYGKLDSLQEEFALQRPDPTEPAQWVQMALANNPTLESSRKAADIAESDIRLRRSANYPELQLIARHTRFTNNEFNVRDDFGNIRGTTSLSSNDKQIALQLNVPLFQGGATWSRTRQARHLFNAAVKDMEQQERATVRGTENAYRAVIAGVQEVEARKQALVSAQSALEATQAGFEVGTRTIVDVLLAEQRFFQAQRDYSQARHTFIVNHLRLRQSAGVLTGTDLVDVNRLLIP